MCPPPEVGTLGLALVEAEIYVTSGSPAARGIPLHAWGQPSQQGTTDLDQSLL